MEIGWMVLRWNKETTSFLAARRERGEKSK
jgi:hypothetical protein